MTGHSRAVTHQVNRLEVVVDLPFEELRARYEQAVPAFDQARFGDLDPDRTDWDSVRRSLASRHRTVSCCTGVARPTC